jgi:hypothetical protein
MRDLLTPLRRLNKQIDRLLSQPFRRSSRVQYGDPRIAERTDIVEYPLGNSEVFIPSEPRIALLEDPVPISQYDYPEAYLLAIHDATLRGRHAAIFTKFQELVMESLLCRMDLLEVTSFGRVYYPASWRELRQQLSHSPHFETIFSLVNVWSGNYFHWTLDALTRLYILELYQRKYPQKLKLLIDPKAPEWMKDSLLLLGYTPEDYLEWDATYAKANTVLLASSTLIHGMRSPSALYWLKEKILQALHIKAPLLKTSSSYIYISRRNSKRRRIVNETELFRSLSKYNISVHVLEDLTFSEQVKLFAQASLIIGPHGAGFSNALYSNNATLVEFFEPSYVNPCYYRMCQGLNLRYHYLLGKSLKKDIIIDTDAVETLLDSLLSKA